MKSASSCSCMQILQCESLFCSWNDLPTYTPSPNFKVYEFRMANKVVRLATNSFDTNSAYQLHVLAGPKLPRPPAYMIACTTRACLKMCSGFEAQHDSLVASAFENECVAGSQVEVQFLMDGTPLGSVPISWLPELVILRNLTKDHWKRVFFVDGRVCQNFPAKTHVFSTLCSNSKLPLCPHFCFELVQSAKLYLHAPILSWLYSEPGARVGSLLTESMLKTMGASVSLVCLVVRMSLTPCNTTCAVNLPEFFCILLLRPLLPYWVLFLHKESV